MGPALTRKQTNTVFRRIAASKINVADCYLGSGSMGTSIIHRPSQSEFNIKHNFRGPRYTLQVRVGDKSSPVEQITIQDVRDLEIYIQDWTNEIFELIATPDLWKMFGGRGEFLTQMAHGSANTPFTADEQAAISAQLREIKEAVKKTCDLTAEQSKHFDEKFEEADKASRRMGRKDWGMFFGGAILSLILCDAITPAIMGHIFMMMEHGIGHLFIGASPSVGGILSDGQD
jgi:hypothetical protein